MGSTFAVGRFMYVLAAVLAAALVVGLAPLAQAAPTAALETNACPSGSAPSAGFTDIATSAHASNIDCVAQWDIAKGTTATTFSPAAPVGRDQMASFIARTVSLGATLPTASPQGFIDVGGNSHVDAINQLAAADIVNGTTSVTYSPAGSVQRDQMASFLVRAWSYVSGSPLSALGGGYFDDTATSTHAPNIDIAFERGWTQGTAPGVYDPSGTVPREQMATFLARFLGDLIASGHVGDALPPADDGPARLIGLYFYDANDNELLDTGDQVRLYFSKPVVANTAVTLEDADGETTTLDDDAPDEQGDGITQAHVDAGGDHTQALDHGAISITFTLDEDADTESGNSMGGSLNVQSTDGIADAESGDEVEITEEDQENITAEPDSDPPPDESPDSDPDPEPEPEPEPAPLPSRPVVSSTTPASGAFVPDPVSVITATFNKSVSADDLGLVEIAPDPGGVGAVVEADNLTLTITFDGSLGDDSYTVTIPQGTVTASGRGNTAHAWSFTVDTTQPAPETFTPDQAAVTSNDSPTISVVFDEDVSEGDLSGASITPGGSIVSLALDETASLQADNRTVLFSYTGTLDDGMYTVSVPGGGVEDPAGHANEAFNWVFEVDATAPSVTSIVRKIGADDPTNAATVEFTVTFSEPVEPVAADDFALTTTGDAAGVVGTPAIVLAGGVGVASGDAQQWTVPVGSVTGDGTIRLDLADGDDSIQDTAGTPLASNTYTGDETFTIDNTEPAAPVITSFPTVNDGNKTAVTISGTAEADSTVDVSVDDASETGAVEDADTATGGNWSVTVNLSGLNDEELTASVTATDAAGNVSTAATDTATKDVVSPSVSHVTSPNQNEHYTVGEQIDVTVVFSEAVIVTGTPQLTLETGDTDRVVNYLSGSGTNTLTFRYAIQAGDTSADLDYVATTSLALNGGTIRDAAGNNAVLTLPEPGAAGSLGANKNIVVDTTAPTIDSASLAGDNSYVDVVFSEGVYTTGLGGLTAGHFSLTFTQNAGDATDVTIDSVTNTADGALVGGESTIRVVLAVTGTPSGTETVEIKPVDGNSIQDRAYNLAADTETTGVLTLNDQVAPSVTDVTSPTADGSYTVDDVIDVTVVFSEAVTVTGTPQLTLETGDTDRVVDYTSGSGTDTLTFAYTVQAGDTSADLDYTGTTALALNGGTIDDAAGNNAELTLASPGAAGSLGANKAIVIDTDAPSVINVTSPDGNLTYGEHEQVAVTVQFSEAVIVTGTPQLTLETGDPDRVANYDSGSGTDTLTFKYTVQAGDNSADLDYVATTSLALNGGTIRDAAGNNAVLTLPEPGQPGSLSANRNIVIDTTAPTIDSASLAGDNSYVDVVFSEGVYNSGVGPLQVGDFALTFTQNTGDATAATITALTKDDGTTGLGGGETTVRVKFSLTDGPASGTETVEIKPVDGNSIFDFAINAAAGTETTGVLTLNDQVAPSVTDVTSPTADGSYTVDDVIDVTVVFSEAVTVTGTPQLTLETGDTDRVVDYTSGSGTDTLTFAYTVQAGDTSADLDYTGTTALALNGGTIDDAAGNNAELTLASPGDAGSLGANKAIVIDTTAPDAPTGASASLLPNAEASVSWTASVSGDVVSQVLEVNTGGGGWVEVTTFGDNSTEAHTYTGGSDGESVEFRVTAVDAAGNEATSAASTPVVLDGTAPSIVSATVDSATQITVTFDEAVECVTDAAVGQWVYDEDGNFADDVDAQSPSGYSCSGTDVTLTGFSDLDDTAAGDEIQYTESGTAEDRVTDVAGNDATSPSAEVAVDDGVAPLATDTFVDDIDGDGKLSVGDQVTVMFDEDLGAVDNAGATSITVVDGDGEEATLVCNSGGGEQDCGPSSGSMFTMVILATVTTDGEGSNDGIQLGAEITAASGITDVAGNAWDPTDVGNTEVVLDDEVSPTIMTSSALADGGGTAGTIEAGDTITVDFSEKIDTATIGTAFDVHVSNDAESVIWVNRLDSQRIVTITTTGAQYNTGGESINFLSSSGVWSNGDKTLTVTLASPSGGAAASGVGAHTSEYEPDFFVKDAAGNGAAPVAVTGASSSF